jgi:hypothetical protein
MKKILSLAIVVFMAFSLAACSNGNANKNVQSTAEGNTAAKNTDSSNTKSEKEVTEVANKGSNMATRMIVNGTAITLKIGNTVIPATLNNSTSSKELLSRLPYTVHLSRYSHDYCGVMEDPLKYDEKDVHYGWMNGDIDFARDGNYFTILFEDEEKSKIYGHQENLGKVDCDLSVIKGLGSSIDVLIELAPGNRIDSILPVNDMVSKSSAVESKFSDKKLVNGKPAAKNLSQFPIRTIQETKTSAQNSDNNATTANINESYIQHEEKPAKDTRIRLTFNNAEIIVKMYNNPTSQDFVNKLPLKLTFEDYAGTEKISYLPHKLSTENHPSGYNPSV